jgi:hypothetical protein
MSTAAPRGGQESRRVDLERHIQLNCFASGESDENATREVAFLFELNSFKNLENIPIIKR